MGVRGRRGGGLARLVHRARLGRHQARPVHGLGADVADRGRRGGRAHAGNRREGGAHAPLSRPGRMMGA
ncbi:hypothetical protein MICRO116_780007 [Micrococcus sp. 116]|nr:hypothetical protein MICRO116_780007 [Micrococcus sp. 116]